MKRVLKSVFIALFLVTSFTSKPMARILATKSTLGKTHFIYGASPRYYTTNQPSAKNNKLSISSFSQTNRTGAIHETCKARCLFGKNHDIQATIISLLNEAEISIDGAFYSFTNPEIANALINAHQRGVKICVVLDPGSMKTHYNRGKDLIKYNIPVYQYNSNNGSNSKYDSLMHHKFFIIDGESVITGSANPTQAAYTRNRENIVILKSPTIALQYKEEFKNLKKASHRLLPHKI